VGVGQFAATATQLEQAGTIKPGAAQLVDALAAKTGNAVASLQNNLFSGQPGAQNLTQLTNSVAAQANVAVSTLEKAQTQLTQAGVMTGKEAPQQVAGMVYAAATQGVDKVVGAVQSIGSGTALGGLTNNIAGAANGVVNAIGSGNFAAGVAQNVTGALAGIQSSAEAAAKTLSLDDIESQAKGAAAAAFGSIASSMKPLQAGIPQNLGAIAKEAAASAAVAAAAPATQNLSAASLTAAAAGGIGAIQNAAQGAIQSGLTSVTSKIPGSSSVASSITQAASSAVGNVKQQIAQAATSTASGFASATSLSQTAGGQFTNLANAAVSQATGALSGAASSIASGVNNLPGGQQAISSVVNKATGAINDKLGSLGNVTGLGNAISSAATDKLNGLASGKMPDLNSLASKALSGLPAGVASSLQGAISSLSAGGQVPIKLPTVATNTVNREDLTAQVKSVLGDPKIPAPNLSGEVPESAKSDFEKKLDKQKELLKVIKEIGQYNDKVATLKADYDKALASLPQGDPGIEKAKQAYVSFVTNGELAALMKRYDEVKIA
jgi:hypothetical protein